MTGAHWYEAAFGPLYPVLYRHRDVDEARLSIASFEELFESRQPVLDLACGAGRHLEALGDAGIGAVGMDLSSTLLTIAAESHAGRIARADMRLIPARDGSVGSVISMFTSFGYFASDEENLGVLREVERVLRPGGMLLLDFFNALPILENPPGVSRREEGGLIIDEERELSEDRNFLIKRVRAQAKAGDEIVSYEERVRMFLPEALEDLTTRAGLPVLEKSGAYDRSRFDPARSDRLILVCQKPEKGGGVK